MRTSLLVALLTSTVVAQSLRPPSVPLVVHDPYFSLWSGHDRLGDGPTTHWTGRPMPMTAMVRIDQQHGCRLLGSEPAAVPALPQTGLQVLPTRTVCTFANDRIAIELTFFSPLLPDDLAVLARPLTYLHWSVGSRDGKAHRVELYFDVSALIAVDHAGQPVIAGSVQCPPLAVASVGSVEQPVLGKRGDDLRIDWGTALLAQRTGEVRFGAVAALQQAFLAGGSIDGVGAATGEQAPGQTALALRAELRVEPDRPASHFAMLAYDDVWSIRYFGADLRPYWRRGGWQAEDLLRHGDREFADLWRRGEVFEQELLADLRGLGGERYAQLCALAYRQCLGANKLCADEHGRPLLFPKENFSNGCIATVDVIYPMAPLFLLLGADLSKAMLVPVLDYAASSRWKFPFAPHDLGTYPHATGQVYGGGERTEQNQMPVEESANLILLVAALAKAEGDAGFAARYWPQLGQWADYLAGKGFDPDRQLCTDDFAGHLAHNVNLSAKAILALGAFAQLCALRQLPDEAQRWRRLAGQFAAQWLQQARDGDGTRLAFDKPGSWSQKYNLVWDDVLGLGLFDQTVKQRELAFYRQRQNAYGLPLDSRATFTKIDWTLWSACLSGDRQDFDAVLAPVWKWVHETPDRVPLCDWYDTVSGRKIHMIARPVVGGFFVRALHDEGVWRKWFARGPRGDGAFAPLPLVEVVPVVAAAEQAPVRWRFTAAAPPAAWREPGFDDSGWQQGEAGFGTEGTPGAVVRTVWNGSDLWIRRSFELTAAPGADLQLWIHHDEDAEVYLNGVLAAKRTGYVTGYLAVPIARDALASLRVGSNVLAVHCRQSTGGQYLDAGLVRVRRRR